MPKDKKSGASKKEEGSTSVELVVKRKNSIVSSSSGGSETSSASSTSSGNTSDHSQSGDSDGSVGFDNEKGTMTSVAGSSSSSNDTSAVQLQQCQVQIRDRTEEMHRLMNNHTPNDTVRLVTDENGVPVTSSTHFVPIQNDGRGPSTSASFSACKEITLPIKQTGKNKQKQLTKKQRKELEKRELEQQGMSASTYPGQKERPKAQPPQQSADSPSDDLMCQSFDDYEDEGLPIDTDVRDGQMAVRATNEASLALLGTPDAIPMPLYRSEEELGRPLTFTDLQTNAQLRYCRFVNTIGKHTNLPCGVKPLHRMGFGIAASGIPDLQPLMLSLHGSKPFMKHKFSDYVNGNKNLIINWRQEFLNGYTSEVNFATPHYGEVMTLLDGVLKQMIEKTPEMFPKGTIKSILDSDLRQLLLRFGEMERHLIKNKYKNGYDVTPEQTGARFSFLTSEVLNWATGCFTADCEVDEMPEARNVTVLMYLATRLPLEKHCFENDHRKCTLLHFLLAKCDRRHHLGFKFHDGNTILHLAAMSGSPCQIDTLLRHHAPLNALNELFKTPIACASKRRTTLQARQLMWHGADVGGALGLTHIRTKTLKETEDKIWSNYTDHCDIGRTPPKAWEFMKVRSAALNNTFSSWVEALLLEAEIRIPLAITTVHSQLHQLRIGGDIFDESLSVGGKMCVKKTLRMAIERGHFDGAPLVLFIIPCRYDAFDTTMPAQFPHIVRSPMLTNYGNVAQHIDRQEKSGVETRQDYKPVVETMRPIRMLAQPPTITYGDNCVEREEILESFLSHEHNGMLYAYNLPEIVYDFTEGKQAAAAAASTMKGMSGTQIPQQMAAASTHTVITLNLIIPEEECNRFSSEFFMCQAIQVRRRDEDTPLFSVSTSSEATTSSYDLSALPQDSRVEDIAAELEKRKQESIMEDMERAKRDEVYKARRCAMQNEYVLSSEKRKMHDDAQKEERQRLAMEKEKKDRIEAARRAAALKQNKAKKD